MNLMANGLAGNEMEFYPIVKDSRWLGGDTDYGNLNEGLPYWFNGLVPLAYGLDNDNLKSQVHNVTDYILSHQDSAGWIGPETVYNSSIIWARFPVLLGLQQLAEANASYTEKIVDALYKFVNLVDGLLEDGLSADEQWGRARYADMSRVVMWLYEDHPRDNSTQLLETMGRLRKWGLDWAGFVCPHICQCKGANTPSQLLYKGFLHLRRPERSGSKHLAGVSLHPWRERRTGPEVDGR